MPRVTVIVAARNAAATIQATLASVREQTFEDWEVIVADDASDDGTAAAVGDDPRVRVIATGGPLGPAGARNLAVAQAGGELVATLDSDDLWEPDFLATQVAAYDRETARGTSVGFVACDARLLDGAGLARDTYNDRVGRRPLTLSGLLVENCVYTSVLMARTVFRELGGYAEDLAQAEDYDLWLRILQSGRAAIRTERPLATYRLRPDSLTAASQVAAQSTARVYERALERGGLSGAQRRLARRKRRLYLLLARRARIAQRAQAGEPVLGARMRLLPLTALVAVEHPGRWLHWLHDGPRSPGPARHAG